MGYKPIGSGWFAGYKAKQAEKEKEELTDLFNESFNAIVGKTEGIKGKISDKEAVVREYEPLATSLLGTAGKEKEADPYLNEIGAAEEEIKVLNTDLREYSAMGDSFKQARDTLISSVQNFDDAIESGIEALLKYGAKLGIETNPKLRSKFEQYRRKKNVDSAVKVRGSYNSPGTLTDYGRKIKERLLSRVQAQQTAVNGTRQNIQQGINELEHSFETATGGDAGTAPTGA